MDMVLPKTTTKTNPTSIVKKPAELKWNTKKKKVIKKKVGKKEEQKNNNNNNKKHRRN